MRILAVGMGLALLLGSAWVAEAQKGEGEAQSLFETRCSACHELERPKSKRKTADAWEKTVRRMQEKRKSGIAEGEAKVIAEFLFRNYGK